jgi:ubiquinone/menaquinone biosynthesis C-methylase UbiE
VIEKMAEVSSVDAASEVADVGTGTGFVAAGIAPRVKRVVGIDNSPAMLEAARENLWALGASIVDLVIGEVSPLPLADCSVDAAFANMVLHHVEDPEAMLREMARAVRPGGMVAITDEVEHPYAWMREEHADVCLGFEWGRWGATSPRSGSKTTATSRWGRSDAVVRPRVRSPTTASSPRGA